MSWLKRDDQRCLHPKIGELTDREYRALDALYEYCARTRNDGYYRTSDLRHAVYATPRGPRSPSRQMNEKWTRLRLVDELDHDIYQIHDWDAYQPKDPTGAERKRLERERKQAETQDKVTELSQDNHATSHSDVTPSRARGPVPSRPITTSQSVNPLLDQPGEERPTDGHQSNGRSAEEQARIDAVDEWWQDPPTAVIERDPYSEPFNDLSPLGEQLAAAKAREEQER